MALPRRKACAACVKAKRRCSLALPSCSRCIEKGQACQYGNVPAITTMRGRDDDFSFLHARRLIGNVDMTFADFEPGGMWSSLGGDMVLEGDSQLVLSQELAPPGPPEVAREDVYEYRTILERPEDLAVSGEICYARSRWTTQRLKTWLKIFHEKGTNSFIHLQRCPGNVREVMTDLMSACALYTSRNQRTERLAFDDISRKVERLKLQGARGFSTPFEAVTCLQALIMYQIIRLFDGDIMLRAGAENDENVVREWTFKVAKYLKDVSKESNSNSEEYLNNPPTWTSWIFDEAVRRTILASYILQSTYSFLRHGNDRFHCAILRLSLTAQSRLWYAATEFQFRQAWYETEHLTLRVIEWDDVIGKAQPDDLDDISVVIFGCHKGLDPLMQWMGQAKFKLYGLDDSTYLDALAL